jgi:hypothetical protein
MRNSILILANYSSFIYAILHDNPEVLDNNRIIGTLCFVGFASLLCQIPHMQLVHKNHLLSISYRINLDYREEVYFIINSIEAAMIHFDNKSVK